MHAMVWLKCLVGVYFSSDLSCDHHIAKGCYEKMHAIMLSCCLKDFRNRIPRNELTILTKKAIHVQWMRYSNLKQDIALYLQRDRSTRLGLKLQEQVHINDWTLDRATLVDFSSLKIGKTELSK